MKNWSGHWNWNCRKEKSQSPTKKFHETILYAVLEAMVIMEHKMRPSFLMRETCLTKETQLPSSNFKGLSCVKYIFSLCCFRRQNTDQRVNVTERKNELCNHYRSPKVKWKIPPSPATASSKEYCQSESGRGEKVKLGYLLKSLLILKFQNGAAENGVQKHHIHIWPSSLLQREGFLTGLITLFPILILPRCTLCTDDAAEMFKETHRGSKRTFL